MYDDNPVPPCLRLLDDTLKYLAAHPKAHLEFELNLIRKSGGNTFIPSRTEANTRLWLAWDVLQRIRRVKEDYEWHFSASQIAVFLVLPLETVERIKHLNPLRALYRVHGLAELSRHFLVGLSQDPDEVGSWRTTSGPSGERICSQEEATKCIRREEGACLLTGSDHPQACHIVPCSINATEADMYRLFWSLGSLKLIDRNYPWMSLLFTQPGTLDCSWNMLAVSGKLRDWWARGYWAVKCLELVLDDPADRYGPTVVRLAFYWMPKRSRLLRSRKIDLDMSEGEAMLEELKDWNGYATIKEIESSDGDLVVQYDPESGRALISGNQFEVRMDRWEDADKMRAMMDLQWALITVASLAGTEGSPELGEEYVEDIGKDDTGKEGDGDDVEDNESDGFEFVEADPLANLD